MYLASFGLLCKFNLLKSVMKRCKMYLIFIKMNDYALLLIFLF